MNEKCSVLDLARRTYRPRLPALLKSGIRALSLRECAATTALRDAEMIRERFPRTYGRPIVGFNSGPGPEEVRALGVGVVLSGGQAPGGHNVIAGLFDAIAGFHAGSRLIGFLGGPAGILDERFETLTAARMDRFRNSGGFDLLGSGRDKIESREQLARCGEVCEKLQLDGLVIIGGDDSNTNATVLSEYFLDEGRDLRVVGVPKTIDGDLKGDQIEISFGFDTASKLYSELVGNICRDARSSGKYWHFIKLMGRSASHVTLECALQTRANVVLIGEEVAARRWTLEGVVGRIVDAIRRRAQAGRQYGVCLVPEGLIEFIPEMRLLIAELNRVLARDAERLAALGDPEEKQRHVKGELGDETAGVFCGLPGRFQRQLLLDRDDHGNVQVSKIETERLLIEQVRARLTGIDFRAQPHFLGYEGRCAAPSEFDADYAYGLGSVAAALIAFGKTGYISSVKNLVASPEQWRAQGVPLTSLMQVESRNGKPTPVIGKALVRLDGAPFLAFAERRADREMEDRYLYPGPIQYFGPPEIAGARTRTLVLEQGGVA